jgi:hypothetical protein
MTGYVTRLAVILLAVWMLFQTQPRAAQAQTAEPDAGGSSVPLACTGVELPAASPGGGAPAIHIVQPANDQTIYGENVEVGVATENFDFNNGGHWHIWVDGQLAGMLYEGAALVHLTPGIHQICAILGDANHTNLGVPDGVTVTVAEAAAGTPTQVLTSPSAAAPQPEGRSTNIALVIGAAVLAIAAGWWAGKRLPKR